MSLGGAYEAHLQKMAAAALRWRAANPTAVPILVVNLPKTHFLVGVIGEAIRNGLVEVNQAGQDLVDAMVAVDPDPRSAPTVAMVRAVLDHVGVAAWR